MLPVPHLNALAAGTFSFLAAFSAEANPGTIPATPLQNRSTNDTASGSIFVEKSPLTAVIGCRLNAWSYFDDDGSGRQITPLLVERTAANTYAVRGIGTTRTSTAAGIQANLPFGLVSGSAIAANADYFFAWKDGGNGANGLGVVDWDNGGSPGVDWMGGGHTSFVTGDVKTTSLSLARTYSVQGHWISPTQPPQITQHPAPLSVYPGQSAGFTVTAAGDGAFSYQWQKGGADIDSATATTFTLSNVTPGDAANYRCVVTSEFGSTASNPAALTVLTPPVVAAGGISINEFVADNAGGLKDSDGSSPDWIEIHNSNAFAVNLEGWRLTDDPAVPSKWVFPLTVIPAGGHLIVFASSKDRRPIQGELHANFKLDPDGEYLALVKPDGSVAQAFAPLFPSQKTNISFGTAIHHDPVDFVSASHTARWLVPPDEALGLTWTGANEPFTDQSWASGQQGLGFDTVGTPVGPPVEIAGNPLLSRPSYDGASGSIFVLETSGFVKNGIVTDWAVVSGTNLAITPLILHREASGSFTIKGIGATRTSVAATVAQNFAFGLVAGSAAVGPGDYLGWKDGSNGANNTGTPSWTDGVANTTVRWFNQHTTFAVAENLGAGQPFSRSYSLQASVRATPGSLMGATVQTAMLNVNPSLFVRLPFSLPSVPPLDVLTLHVNHEDGFVAWLNGVEIARRNAPAVLARNSTASADRPRADQMTAEAIDVTAFIGQLQAGSNVLAIQALNDSASNGEFLIRATLDGDRTTPLANHYMLTPTPGAANGDGISGFVADTTFTPKRGFYGLGAPPITVTITTATPGATIRCTVDGSIPTLTNGFDYPAGGLIISGTTTVRAVAFKSDFAPTNVDTHTFVFAGSVLSQPAAPPGFPATWAGTAGDYEMDPNVTVTESQLRSLPLLCVTTSRDDLFGAAGIYANSSGRGDAWERAASIEFIDPNSATGHWQADCGASIAGDSSRGHGFTLKHHLLFSFKQQFGPSKLHQPVFPDSTENDFDILEARACSTDSWPVQNGYVDNGLLRWETARATYLRDQWMRDAQRDLGQPTSHGRYVHLYLDGLYWGLYNLCERMGAGWSSEHLGGPKEEWDVMKDYAEVEDGTRQAWDEMTALAGQELATEAAYQKIQGRNPDGTVNPAYPVYLNVDSLIDYMILHIQAGSEDWPGHNWWASRRRGQESGGFHFHVWDQEISNISPVRTQVISGFGQLRFENVNTANSPAFLYDKLRANPSFQARFKRRMEGLFFGGGPLTVAKNAARWDVRQTEVDAAIRCESARWGDVRREPPFTHADWMTEMTWQANFWAANQPITIQRFASVNLWPGDADSDGMPDTWEQRHGLSTASNDANSDSDHDGRTNYQEFLADTHPLDPASNLAAIVIHDAAGIPHLQFTAAAGRSYAVQHSSELTSWTTFLTVPAAPQGASVDALLPEAPEAPRRFYRVLTPAP